MKKKHDEILKKKDKNKEYCEQHGTEKSICRKCKYPTWQDYFFRKGPRH